ncbi:hypothetical protein SARC_10123 [Sphaeroforma arctica JP610]|uniref:Glycoside hydrolase family 57 N-terminal domain-containing protein n=1 Tax=Sphaeroforma arctica JP610 TaxID=667725 RepID=A0A0L0FN03_9EUKA|nr:hypothetical protein SARC_10123 [Sphaeroforma arctica JP610]KNC77418.1 hypothetical protein SARC_10123 [Sphaeroforma arctica JP610]|eukprot:XP_014151320.1 hypothetical protein SARC_10123 [Sphaeroforma arctica JP610]
MSETFLPVFTAPESDAVVHGREASSTPASLIDFDSVSAGFCTVLHMHQPSIPCGKDGTVISNLQYMFEHPEVQDAHNAGPFLDCYGRMGDIIPRLIRQGHNPRVSLDYSGTLLWGLQQMHATNNGVFDKLKRIANDPQYIPHVEWLGTFWAHAVAGSVPVPDIEMQIVSWKHHFASIFGAEAMQRVKGFSPPEMQLPNQPDTLYELVRSLNKHGYKYMLVQEHTIETIPADADDQATHIRTPHLPHVLVAQNSAGEEERIVVLVKTQGSDTKLVGQMQPYYEAKTLSCMEVGGVSIPPLVTQIADGENGGVMMNEFPSAFDRAWEDIRDNKAYVGINGSEYLRYIFSKGVSMTDLPLCQAKGQAKLWAYVGKIGKEKVPDTESHESVDGSKTTEGATTVSEQKGAATGLLGYVSGMIWGNSDEPTGTDSAQQDTQTPDIIDDGGGRKTGSNQSSAIYSRHGLDSGLSADECREAVTQAIKALSESDHEFHMEGASWTNERSWVNGYQNVTGPMHELSAKFHSRVSEFNAEHGDATLEKDERYQMAMLYVMLLQCSCFRYWGQGDWPNYARELFRRGVLVLEKPFGTPIDVVGFSAAGGQVTES